MLAPIDKAAHGRNDIMQLVVCRKCDIFNCSECTQLLPFRKDAVEMSVDCFREAVQSMDGWPGVVAVFGGNPCSHSRFPDLCQIMREEIPDQRKRGLWTNNLLKHGEVIRDTFWPHGRFNLNVHGSREAANEMGKWLPGIKVFGLTPVHHSPMLLNHLDFGISEPEWIALRERCDINQNWSGAIYERDGKPFGYFCEVAGSLDGIRGANNGIPAVPGWWKSGMDSFAHQVKHCCDAGCGVPLRRQGHLDNADTYSVSPSFVPLTVNAKGRVKIEECSELPPPTHEFTDYIGLRK